MINPIRLELRQSTEKYNISNEHIANVVKHIENNFTDNLCIESLKTLVPFSRRNLEIKFKNEMGISIYQFVLKCRVEYCAMLLITTDRTLLDLAFEVGFYDSKNISRVFKKYIGYSPVEYRKKFKLDENPQE